MTTAVLDQDYTLHGLIVSVLPDAAHALCACAAVVFYTVFVLFTVLSLCALRSRRSAVRALLFCYSLVALTLGTQYGLLVLNPDDIWAPTVLRPLALGMHALVCTLLWLAAPECPMVAFASCAPAALTLALGVTAALASRAAVLVVSWVLAVLAPMSLYVVLLALGLAQRYSTGCAGELPSECGIVGRPSGELVRRPGGLWVFFTLAYFSPVPYWLLERPEFTLFQALVARLVCDGVLLLLVPIALLLYRSFSTCGEPYYLHDSEATRPLRSGDTATGAANKL